MPVTESAVIVGAKIGVGTASTGIFASAMIFTDPAYAWMSFIGALISVVSTFHTIFSNVNKKFTKMQKIAELLKGFALGLIAMPLGFLLISEGVFAKLIGLELGAISLSLSFVSAFLFSWYMIPLVDAMFVKFKKEDRRNKYERYTDYEDIYRQEDDYDNPRHRR